MLDPKLLEQNPKVLESTLRVRGMLDLLEDAKKFLKLREDWKKLKKKVDDLRHERNKISLEINEAIKRKKKKEAELKKKEAKKIAEDVRKAEDKIAKYEKILEDGSLKFPNIPAADVPLKDKIVSIHGEAKREKFHKTYEEIAKSLGLIDFDSAITMSGSGFYTLVGKGAKLERTLINFFLDLHEKQGYKEMLTPLLVSEKSMINSGQLPKFKDAMFKTQEDLYLIPTSEVSLLNLYADKILHEQQLPIKVTAFSPCFRTEKGATKGIFRVRQFSKVEMFKFTRQEESFKELDGMLKDATAVLDLLGIPYRVKLLSAPEMGFASAKTYDIEAFAPGLNEWLEVSSVSNCTDFQARRAKIRYISGQEKKLVHTLNGSGLAVPRTIIALLENYQQKDGSIKIPQALEKYFGARKIEK
ncbi:MAG: serine--tRNA ligase [Nanoarchaeota archaeon]